MYEVYDGVGLVNSCVASLTQCHFLSRLLSAFCIGRCGPDKLGQREKVASALDIQLECAVAQAEAASTPAVLDMQSPAVWCVARGVSSLTGVTTPSQARGSKRVNVRECSVRIAELRQPFESLPNARVGKSQSSLLLRQGSHIGHRTPARE